MHRILFFEFISSVLFGAGLAIVYIAAGALIGIGITLLFAGAALYRIARNLEAERKKNLSPFDKNVDELLS